MYELETLVVPEELGVWLEDMILGESCRYFTMIDELSHYWDTVIGSETGGFIFKNKKELIEVILGSRGYRVETPLYRALIKGHELVDSAKSYWYFNKSVDGVFISNVYNTYHNLLWEMTKAEWNKVGINDSNADFVKVKGMTE